MACPVIRYEKKYLRVVRSCLVVAAKDNVYALWHASYAIQLGIALPTGSLG